MTQWLIMQMRIKSFRHEAFMFAVCCSAINANPPFQGAVGDTPSRYAVLKQF